MNNLYIRFKGDLSRNLNLLFFALVFLFIFALNPVISHGKTLDYVSVGLKYAGSAVTEAKISADAGLALASYGESGFLSAEPLILNGNPVKSLTAVNSSGNIVLKGEDETVLADSVRAEQVIVPVDYDAGGTLKFGTNSYRGGIILKKDVAKIDVINYLSLEQYVYGVIAAEIGSGSPVEAIKAQAVAARSFAGANEGAHRSYGFDVCSTTHCQVYKGVSGESAGTNKAVDDTRGQMIYSEGKPVNAYYAKNSGGHTQNSEDVWFAALPYLRGIKDEYEPNYPWEATITFDELQKKLESAGYNPGTLASVSITKRSAAGAVYTLVIKGSNETVTLNKDGIRTTLGGSQIKSLMFQFVGGTSGSQGAAGPQSEYTYVVSGNGAVAKVATKNVYASNGTVTVKWSAGESSNTDNQTAVETVTDGTLYIKGKGYGHGVGLQQDGAIAMAKSGFTYRDILNYYYTDIEIK